MDARISSVPVSRWKSSMERLARSQSSRFQLLNNIRLRALDGRDILHIM